MYISPPQLFQKDEFQIFHCIFVVPVRSLDPDNGKVPRSRKNKGIPVHSPTTWMFCFFFLPTSPPKKKARKVGNLGGKFARTSCLGWLLKPVIFLGGRAH